jgi:hypothetical protein
VQKILGGLVVALGLGLAAPASADWEGHFTPRVGAPGYAWATCSAPYDCVGPAYVRRVSPRRHEVTVSHRQVRTVRRPHRARTLAHHKGRLAVRAAGYRATGYYVPWGSFEYIYDPQLAAVAAWADIVNAEVYR